MALTVETTGQFLDGIENDRLYPLFHLIAYRGTRRGETCGARWVDLSKAASSLKVSEQLVQLGWKVEAGKPKSEAGDRTIGLDDVTNNVLEAWRKRQIAEQLAYGPGWIRSGRIFTRTDGAELHPAENHEVLQPTRCCSGPAADPASRSPARRRNPSSRGRGRHQSRPSALVGHSTSVLTRDTYTSVSPRLAKEAAEKVAKMVPRRAS
jgi:integrase